MQGDQHCATLLQQEPFSSPPWLICTERGNSVMAPCVIFIEQAGISQLKEA